MGLLKKIRKSAKKRQRKNMETSEAQAVACKDYDSSEHLFGEDIIIDDLNSNPNESLYFCQMNDFEVPGCASSSSSSSSLDDSASYNKSPNKRTDESSGGWILTLLSACIGSSSYNETTEDEPTYYVSSTTTSDDHDEVENDDDADSVASSQFS